MSKELDNIFIDVRNSFRLLNRYQKRILHIVSYIREQTPFNDMWGCKDWYSKEIGKRKSPNKDFASLKVYKDMWGWDFLYGYIFEYYFGWKTINNKKVEMSIFQISDDGFFISQQEHKHMTDVTSFEPSESSHSYLVFNVAIYSTEERHWLSDPSFPKEDHKTFLTKFLSSPDDSRSFKYDNGEVVFLKKYEMQKFATQQGADDVIRNFGKIIKEQADVELFKSIFYK